jgi:hypothetical protein
VSVQIAGSDDELMGDRQVLIDYFTDIVTSLYVLGDERAEFEVPHHRLVQHAGILPPDHDDDVVLVELETCIACADLAGAGYLCDDHNGEEE